MPLCHDAPSQAPSGVSPTLQMSACSLEIHSTPDHCLTPLQSFPAVYYNPLSPPLALPPLIWLPQPASSHPPRLCLALTWAPLGM